MIDPLEDRRNIANNQQLQHDSHQSTWLPSQDIDDQRIECFEFSEVPDAEHDGDEHPRQAVQGEAVDDHVEGHILEGGEGLGQELGDYHQVRVEGEDSYVEGVE